MFSVCRYQGRPAFYDATARVYYFCRSMRAAQKRVDSLNRGE